MVNKIESSVWIALGYYSSNEFSSVVSRVAEILYFYTSHSFLQLPLNQHKQYHKYDFFVHLYDNVNVEHFECLTVLCAVEQKP